MTRIRLALSFALVVVWCGVALAQTATTGAIQGVVRDEGGNGLAGVTVVAQSRTTGTSQSALTDADGAYEITNLAPGLYDVTFYYADVEVKRPGMVVSLGKVTPVHAKLDTSQAGGETIVVEGSAPTIDIGSTKQGVSIDQDYTRNIPVPGRTFASALGAAPGSQGDLYGVSFSGSSSLENSYIVDGVNTTGLNFGDVSTALINEFIQETEIITGGYNAEFGRATGGVVNVVTKSGTNEFKGSVFMYGTTDSFTADAVRPERAGTSIESDVNLAFDTDFGFELGGPIVKDKVWFYVGFAPRLRRFNIDKVTQRRIDCLQVDPDTGDYRRNASGELDCQPAPESQGGYADGDPDIDLKTGFPLYEPLDSQRFTQDTQTYQFVSKINFAVTPEHQGQVSLTGTPLDGRLISVRGEPSATQRDFQQLTTDLSAKWTSKFNDNKTEVETVLGWHRVKTESDSAVPGMDRTPLQLLYYGDLYTWGQGFGSESEKTLAGCRDNSHGNANDPYPLIRNCPEDGLGLDGIPRGYAVGGIGSILNNKEERLSAKLTASQRVRAAGTHVFKGGLDVEDNRSVVPRHLSGGAFYSVFLPNNVLTPHVEMRRFAKINQQGGEYTCGVDSEMNPIRCDFFDGANPATGETLNWAGFVQDSWSIRPNLTLNAGLRYEEQRLRYSKELRNTIDPITGDQLGTNAMVLKNLWAPRLGAIYDWTKEGRSKVYGHWGRFYESVPMRINERSFGGETFLIRRYDPSQCGPEDPRIGGPNGENCPLDEAGEVGNTLFGSGVIVAPGVKPQFMDEVVLGVEYELFEDMRVGVSYTNRRLGRVLEDLSTDGANTYIIANPGEFDKSEEDKLQAEIDAMDPTSAERKKLEQRLEMFRGIRKFDKGKRNYNGVTLLVNKRFSRNFFLQAAYTYQRTRGNFPGLFSPDTGQLDPNITSQFDLIELLANRDGPLPQDRPHYIKFDGYYVWDFQRQGQLVTGIRLRALSGTPVDALGRHWRYGFNESYLLPRGSFGRTPFEKSADIHVAYAREIRRGYQLEVFFDVFNIVNDQGTALVDEGYTFNSANPIVGGSKADLVYLKQTDLNDGTETPLPVGRNINFGNTISRYAPRSGRIGLRLTF
ncbi:MAG: hypothetical protein D6689_15825 [Deltaproteobacteria bacterium]|nr:MAG: hypothetical protein D6689_15825 [Deltaproteobacteria bacterium]